MALNVIRAGTAVQIIWTLSALNPAMLPAIVRIPYDPPAPPSITIFDPSGEMQVNAQAMLQLASGIYSYTYVTPAPPLLLAGVPNIWNGYVTLLDANGVPSGSADRERRRETMPLFQLV